MTHMLRALADSLLARQSARAAVEGPSETLTYRELGSRVREVARQVRAVDPGLGAPIGVHLPSSPSYVAAVAGILDAGAAFVPLQRDWPIERITRAIRHVRPRLVLCTAGPADEVASALEQRLESDHLVADTVVDDRRLCDGRLLPVRLHFRDRLSGATHEPVAPERADRAYVLFTSGSTGAPKAIEGSCSGLAHFLEWEIGELGLGPSTRAAQLSPLSFDVSLRDIFVPLLAGGVICIPEAEARQHPVALLQWIIDAEVTLIHVVPTVLRLLIQELEAAPHQAAGLRSLEHVVCAGEPLHASDVARWQRAVGGRTEVVNLYGPSETTLAKVFWRAPRNGRLPAAIPLGRPLPDTEVLVLKDGQKCRPGEIGEIHIATLFRSHGYFGDADLTGQRFIQNPLHTDYRHIVYRTGDLGELNADGELLFRGRVDGQVKVRGNRVDPGEVEAALLELPGVKAAVVLPGSKDEQETELCAFYVGEAPAEDLGLRLRSLLPDYMVPARFIPLTELPLSGHGKVNRHALQGVLEAMRGNRGQTGKPRQPAESFRERAYRWWQDVLDLDVVPVDLSFAALGGSSLGAMKLVSRAYHECGLEVLVTDVFAASSVVAFGDWLASEVVVHGRSKPIAPSRRTGPASLSSCQRRMWDLAAYEPAKLSYNEAAAFEIRGPLDIATCDKVYAALVDRHEILMSTFEIVGGEPKQIVSPAAARQPRVQRVSFKRHCDAEDRAAQFMSAQRTVPFNLGAAPCIRVFLLEIEEDRNIVFAVFYHIIMDQFSQEILVGEAAALYSAITAGYRARLPASRLQYRDYVEWQGRRQMQPEVTDPDRRFWRRHLTPVPSRPALRGGCPRPPIKTYTGGVLTASVDEETTAGLEHLGRLHDASRFMVILACGYALVAEWSGEGDVVLGVPVTTRTHPDLETIVGPFLNTLPIRVRVDTSPRFPDLLANVRTTVLHCLEHGDYPFESIVRELGVRTPYSRTPLFDVMVATYEDPLLGVQDSCEDRSLVGHRSKVRSYPVVPQRSKFDLTMFFVRTECGMDVRFEYNLDLFGRTRMAEMLDDCLSLITRLAARDLTVAASRPSPEPQRV
jgi:amino acid adenylation domain-containing protein